MKQLLLFSLMISACLQNFSASKQSKELLFLIKEALLSTDLKFQEVNEIYHFAVANRLPGIKKLAHYELCQFKLRYNDSLDVWILRRKKIMRACNSTSFRRKYFASLPLRKKWQKQVCKGQ